MDDNSVSTKVENDEISLLDLVAVLLKYKVMICVITGIAMVAVLVYSIVSLVLPADKSYLPNEYSPTAEMLIKEDSSSGSTLSSMLNSSGLGSLAGLAGVSAKGGTSNSALAEYLIYSNTVLDAITDKFNLIEKYEIEKSPRFNSRDILKKQLVSSFDDNSTFFQK